MRGGLYLLFVATHVSTVVFISINEIDSHLPGKIQDAMEFFYFLIQALISFLNVQIVMYGLLHNVTYFEAGKKILSLRMGSYKLFLAAIECQWCVRFFIAILPIFVGTALGKLELGAEISSLDPDTQSNYMEVWNMHSSNIANGVVNLIFEAYLLAINALFSYLVFEKNRAIRTRDQKLNNLECP